MGRLGALLRPTWRSYAGPPQWHYNPCLLQSRYEERPSRCFILPPEQGWQGNTIHKGAKRPENCVTRFPVEKSGAARIGGGERSEPISRILIMSYDTESNLRNAGFILIAR